MSGAACPLRPENVAHGAREEADSEQSCPWHSAGWQGLQAGPETARDTAAAQRGWAFLIDAFNNYCLSNRRQSEIVSKANQSGTDLEVGSEICASHPRAVAVI